MALRVTLLIKKLDAISYEEFHQYWEGPHAEMWLALQIVKEKVLKFSQFHVDRTLSDEVAKLGFPKSEYDGGVDIWVATIEDLKAIFADPEFQRVVAPDGAVFSKTTESRVMVGHDKDFVANGKRL